MSNDLLQTFWRHLGGYIEAAFSLWGAPTVLAQRVWLNGAEYKRCNEFLRALEDLLRRLLFIDALAVEVPTPAEAKSRVRAGMQVFTGAGFNLDDSSGWRAPFQVLAVQSARSGSRRARRVRQAIKPRATAPLALRLEALIRGFNDPAPLALRLARALRRLPRAISRFLIAPKPIGVTRAAYSDRIGVTRIIRACFRPDTS